MKFELPKLTYDYNALEPFIDALTTEIHYSKHHATYVSNLNKALEEFPELQNRTIEELLTSLDTLPEKLQGPVKNNGGGHYNHSLFWQFIAPNSLSAEPIDGLKTEINETFGDFAKFKESFNKAGMSRFGSGWVWLVRNNGKLTIETTPNQASPISEGKMIVFGVDVWEHAYYLKYQNRRAEYLGNIWNVLNWDFISQR